MTARGSGPTHNHIGVFFCREDERFERWFDRLLILIQDLDDITTALHDVSPHSEAHPADYRGIIKLSPRVPGRQAGIAAAKAAQHSSCQQGHRGKTKSSRMPRPPRQSNISVRIDKYLQVEEVPDLLLQQKTSRIWSLRCCRCPIWPASHGMASPRGRNSSCNCCPT